MHSAFAIIFLFICTSSIATSRSQDRRISTLVPSCGPLNGATLVFIKGTGFLPNDQIKFGGSVLSGPHVDYKSTEEIILIISGASAKEAKNFTVEVVSQDGKVKSNIMYFYVYDTPNFIQEIQPRIGWEDDTLTAKGQFLDCGAVKCRFGAVQMTVDATVVSKDEIKCKVPPLDNHGVSSINQNRSSDDLTQISKELNETSNSSSPDGGIQKPIEPPPDPDNAKKFFVSSDGQHFDSIPDNIVFTYRDPVKYVADWIWLVCILVAGALSWLACLVVCCCCGIEAIKKTPCCKRCFKSRKGYTKI